eukprot:15244945-Ditylum_brightwellii.AAC.1
MGRDKLTSNQHLMPQLEIANDTAPEPLIVNPSIEYNKDLFDAILTAYYKYKEVPIDERPKIPKLKWSFKSKKLTVTAGKEAECISDRYDVVNLEDLNTLYYATAFTVSPSKLDLMAKREQHLISCMRTNC